MRSVDVAEQKRLSDLTDGVVKLWLSSSLFLLSLSELDNGYDQYRPQSVPHALLPHFFALALLHLDLASQDRQAVQQSLEDPFYAFVHHHAQCSSPRYL